MRNRIHGFTLIELLVAVAIMAVVAAVAMPLYTSYSERAYRSEAQSDLLNCAQALERFAAINFTYEGSADTDGDNVGDADAGAVGTDLCNPLSATGNRYTFGLVATAAGFTLTATPTGAMSGDGFIRIDAAGNRAWDENNNGSIDADENDWSH